MTMPAVLLIVYALAVARLTKLVNSDRVLKAPRVALLKRLPEESIWAYFVVCPWCVSMWIGFVAGPVTWWWGGLQVDGVPSALAVPALALAYSAFTGYLGQFAEE